MKTKDIDEEGARRQAEAAWNTMPALRTEFRGSGKAGYVALCVAEAKGICSTVGGRVTRASLNKAGEHVRGNV